MDLLRARRAKSRARGRDISGVHLNQQGQDLPYFNFFFFIASRQQTLSSPVHVHRRGNVCKNLTVYNCRQGETEKKRLSWSAIITETTSKTGTKPLADKAANVFIRV